MIKTSPVSLLIVLPVFNDWVSAWRLLRELDHALGTADLPFEILIVDDGSTEKRPASLPEGLKTVGSIRVLDLWCNCGHQRAITLGLAWGVAAGTWTQFLVMDSDGEDVPGDAVKLVLRHSSAPPPCAVFAERRRRSEGMLFKTGYQGYRWIHRVLTGTAVRVGNFSVIDRDVAGRVVHMAESWNHYAATVFKSRVPRVLVPTNRGSRYAGASSMNLPALVAHGFSALAVQSEVVAVRLGSGALLITCTLCLLALWVVMTHGASAITVCLAVVALSSLVQAIAGGVSLALTTLSARSQQGFIPGRDYTSLIKGLTELELR